MNQKITYIGMLAIIPLVMIAIVPNYIGEADAANEHLIAIEKLKVLNAVPEQPTAELSLVQMFEPKETTTTQIPTKGFVPRSAGDDATTYKVLYRVLNVVDSDVRDVEISVNSDTQTFSAELQGDLHPTRNSVISVMIKAQDPASINAEITGFSFKN